MEPTEMDDLFKKSVNEVESKANMSGIEKDRLWSEIQMRPERNTSFVWKLASVILLLLCMGLTFQLYRQSNETQRLSIALVNEQERWSNMERQKTETEAVQQPQVRTEIVERTVRDTVVRYVNREKVVYREVEKLIVANTSNDSLIEVLDQQKEQIAGLQDDLNAKKNVTSEDYSANMEIAFRGEDQQPEVSDKKDGKFKFQLSLINIQ